MGVGGGGGKKKQKKLFAILKNVIEKSFNNWRVLPLVKIKTRISDTLCILIYVYKRVYASLRTLYSTHFLVF
jgi:hypothetical protein